MPVNVALNNWRHTENRHLIRTKRKRLKPKKFCPLGLISRRGWLPIRAPIVDANIVHLPEKSASDKDSKYSSREYEQKLLLICPINVALNNEEQILCMKKYRNLIEEIRTKSKPQRHFFMIMRKGSSSTLISP
jgi:hypothetical protein